MEIRHDEEMSGGIGLGVETNEAVSAAMDDMGGLLCRLLPHSMCNGIVCRCDHVAEDTVRILCRRPVTESRRDGSPSLCVRAGDVAVAPRSPKTIHISASIAAGPTWRNKRYFLIAF